MIFWLLLALVGCVSDVETLDEARFTTEDCIEAGATRCDGETAFQSCEQWRWYNRDACVNDLQCVDDLGCVGCDPFQGPTCVGDDVHVCHDDGAVGVFLEACQADMCHLGYCLQSDCPPETQLIYLIDSERRLISFDPADDAFTFDVLGTISCDTAAPLPGWGSSTQARPNSMSVDRGGTAWVAWTSGEIFNIPIRDPDNCSSTGWVPQTGAFERFGMGFVSNEPSGDTETLHITGGTVADLAIHLPSRSGRIDPSTYAFSADGTLPPTENNPELTGTGLAEFFGYVPGIEGNQVVQIDKSTGGFINQWPLPPLDGEIRAWAFAHWGGRFYLFVTIERLTGDLVPQVLRFDRETGGLETVVGEHPYRVVGAGVSTCAPVVFQ
jgi:hypothetical protein